jgi:glycosyltransferase involved in cell wall biosynthesis
MESHVETSIARPIEVHVSARTPRVSIGLPVYNGAEFLAAALDSLLAQTFTDFELIVSDNASTDATESLCRERARRDRRVRYYRNDRNVGGRANFNRVFELSTGEYFKWAAHDDVHEPEYLERCVDVLDRDPAVVLVHPRVRDIDERGNTLKIVGFGMDSDTPSVATRFRELARREHSCVAFFGLVRADVLRRTRLLSNYADCDRVLLVEIAMAGRIHELPDPLFQHRQHGTRSVKQYRTRQTRNAWFDPRKGNRPAFPYTRQFWDLVGAIRRARVPAREKLACAAHLPAWLAHNADGLREDADYAVRFVLRPVKRLLIPTSGSASHGSGGNR